MYCKKCGNQVERLDNFCTKCGTELKPQNVSFNPIPKNYRIIQQNSNEMIRNYFINEYK